MTETPNRYDAPALARDGKKRPVIHGVTKRRIGDVVGGQREAINVHADFTRLQRCVRLNLPLGAGKLVFADQKTGGTHDATFNKTASRIDLAAGREVTTGGACALSALFAKTTQASAIRTSMLPRVAFEYGHT